MNIARKSSFFIGIFVFIIPFLGFPSMWKMSFTVAAGILLILSSIKINLPKKGSRHKTNKEKVTPVFMENAPIISPRNDTIEVISRVPVQEVPLEYNEPTVEIIKPAPRRARVIKKSNGQTV